MFEDGQRRGESDDLAHEPVMSDEQRRTSLDPEVSYQASEKAPVNVNPGRPRMENSQGARVQAR